MVSREIILSEATGAPVHIAHISTRGSAELIRQAKRRGVKVTCETCPHYFSLTDKACDGFNTNAKMNPPLRTDDDVAAIKEAIADGTVDAIATDNAPHHVDEKNCEFANAANGIVGFETALGLSIKCLVNEGVITINKLIDLMASNPASILGLNKGSLTDGQSADVVIFDTEEWMVDKSQFASKSNNTPFDRMKLKGRILYTIVDGNIVYDNSEICESSKIV